MWFFIASTLGLTALHNVEGLMQPTLRRTTNMQLRMSTAELKVPTLDQQILVKTGSWFAILSKYAHEGVTLPIPIEVAGEKLVAWKSPITSEWSVMRDECPHRLAPLSQGRVDSISGCIECPYHGQQFDGSGACTKIPQSSATSYPASTAAISLPVHHTGDLLWAFIPLPPGQASYYPTFPEVVQPYLLEAQSFIVRDFPYSFDFFIENFMDPAHVPFAHHSLQGYRADGCPVPMQVLTKYDNASTLEVQYQDTAVGKIKEGIVSFTAPFYYHSDQIDPQTRAIKQILIAVVMPVSPGKCRLFLTVTIAGVKKIPTWLQHYLFNKFLETDIWIHDQERFQRSGSNSFIADQTKNEASGIDGVSDIGNKYVTTTTSDTGTVAFRKWWKMHMAASPIFGEPKVPIPWMSHETKFDRFEAHAKNCKSCSGAHKNAVMVKKYAPFLAVLLAAILPNRVLKVVGIIFAAFVNEMAERIITAITGYKKGDQYSTAQWSTEAKEKKYDERIAKAKLSV